MRLSSRFFFIFLGVASLYAIPPQTYFQQYVRYQIDVDLDIDLHRLDVMQKMSYVNHSPDTLYTLYFYLYYNKYQKNSLVYPDVNFDQAWINIFKVEENDSLNPVYTVDATLMQLQLLYPLAPADSANFTFKYAVILPTASGRYGYQGYHYDVGNWYITPVVYDRYGWHLHQHLDNEFYQEWGDFEVTINVPKGFLVGATGDLLNAEAVLADSIVNSMEWMRADSKDTTLIPWKFRAENVHDFAWTTDPSYVLLQAEWQGITLNVLAMDYNEKSWAQVTDWGMKAIQFFCETIGWYPYNQLTVADTYIRAGGIEYPQIVMINDFIDPDQRPAQFISTVIHEIAHNWFYGLLANNQTEDEWMDEGFTTFMEILAMEAIFGKEDNLSPGNRGWIINKVAYTNDDRLDNAYSYLRLTKLNLDADPINLYPDYLGLGGYTLQYSKMAAVLFMLQYTVGDSLFSLGLQNYYQKWHFRHPYPEDFYAVFEKTCGRKLDWFFEQWLNTNRKCDYSIRSHKGEWINQNGNRRYLSQIRLQRKEQIFMPIDLDLTLKNGTVKKYHIPVDMFSKKDHDRSILPYWHFSQEFYQTELLLTDAISKIEIDPSLRLMDINRLDNVSGLLPPQEIHFMKLQSMAPPLEKYLWEVWPKLHYNDIDKFKFGVKLDGGYLNIDHKIDLLMYLNTAHTIYDYDLFYTTPRNWFGNLGWLEARVYHLEGREGGRLGFFRQFSIQSEPNTTLEFGLKHQRLFDEHYLMAPWSKGTFNTLYTRWQRSTSYFRGWKTKQMLDLYLFSSVFGSKSDFSQFSVTWFRKFWDGFSDWEFDFRFFVGGSDGELPLQHLFNLGGDNSWGEFQEPFYRSRGSFPISWRRNGHLFKSGGGNIRGVSLLSGGANRLNERILALNLDLKLPNPLEVLRIPLLSAISPYVFGDIGAVWENDMPDAAEFDRSLGISVEWQSLDLLNYLFNLKSVRVDAPLWIQSEQSGADAFDFRWLIRFNFE